MSLVQPVTTHLPKVLLSKIQAHHHMQVLPKVQPQLQHSGRHQRIALSLTVGLESLKPGGACILHIPRMVTIQAHGRIQVLPEVQPQLYYLGRHPIIAMLLTAGSESRRHGGPSILHIPRMITIQAHGHIQAFLEVQPQFFI